MTIWHLQTDPAVVRAALAYAANHSAAATGRRFGVADTSVAHWLKLAAEHGPDWPPLEADALFRDQAAYRAHKAASVAAARKRRYLRMERLVVDATGTHRRIRALVRMGWSTQALADRGGWISGEAVQSLLKHPKVNVRNRDRIERLYNQLSMVPGPSQHSARYAERMGWEPPLAWEDIDNDPAPAVVEVDHQTRRVRACGKATVADRVEDAEWMADAGENLTAATARLGVTADALWTACRRAGRRDVYERLAHRELDSEKRQNVSAALRGSERVA